MAKKTNNINTNIFCALKVAEMSRVPVLLMSNPGLGKSTTVSLFAKVRGYEVTLLRGNSTSAEEVMGYDVAPKEVSLDHPTSAVPLRPAWFEEILRNKAAGKKTLLFLDEITTANEFVQAALLHLIFERKVKTESLPEDTLIVSAGNYSQNLSSTMNMLPPVMNRFCIFNIVPDSGDLDTFLNKYEGAILDGKEKNYFDELQKMMQALDAQELKVDDSKKAIIGEHIERAIKNVAKNLMTAGDKPVDMSVTDLQGIYADTADDAKLYGFVTLRTLCYLRDVTIAYYLCFGKSGISSDNYRNSIDGLCGIGVSRDTSSRSGDIKITKIGDEFYNFMQKIVNDIAKLDNSKLPVYEKFFKDVVADESKKSLTSPEVVAIGNKISELNRDKEIENIERPIDPDLISKIGKIISTTAKNIMKDVTISSDRSQSVLSQISAETISGKISEWNMISELCGGLVELVNNPGKKYDPSVKTEVKSLVENIYKMVAIKLRSCIQFIKYEDPAVAATLPEVKQVKSA